MAKRLHDTDCWSKKWFRHLKTNSKLLWLYILDKCDCAGVWEIDLEQATFFTGIKFSDNDLMFLSKQFFKIDEKRLFVLDFIPFQYGEILENHKMYKKINSILANFGIKYPIDTLSIQYPYPIDTVKDMDMDKDKDKDKNLKGEYKGDKNWRSDYKTYRVECSEAFDKMIADWNFIREKKEYYPTLNIRKSLEKMFFEYWEKEKLGWIKKKQSKTENIDWIATAENGLSMSCNQVKIPYGQRDEEKDYLEIMEKRNASKN